MAKPVGCAGVLAAADRLPGRGVRWVVAGSGRCLEPCRTSAAGATGRYLQPCLASVATAQALALALDTQTPGLAGCGAIARSVDPGASVRFGSGRSGAAGRSGG